MGSFRNNSFVTWIFSNITMPLFAHKDFLRLSQCSYLFIIYLFSHFIILSTRSSCPFHFLISFSTFFLFIDRSWKRLRRWSQFTTQRGRALLQAPPPSNWAAQLTLSPTPGKYCQGRGRYFRPRPLPTGQLSWPSLLHQVNTLQGGREVRPCPFPAEQLSWPFLRVSLTK